MALSILDGNQTAVTLATTVSGSAHYPNHIIASGTVTANVQPQQSDDTDPNIKFIPIGYATVDGGGQLDQWTAVDELSPLPVYFPANNPLPAGTSQIGSVTANSSNGSLTTRFGSVTTANTAFETSAVTNANRKYLLIQNVTTASNVITVGIGFTPTTTQGIQIVAGATITFDGNYIPTGAVRILSSVTASNFTVLEA